MIVPVEQQSPDWLAMRVGRVTGSRVADVMAKLAKKDAEAACRRQYKFELVCEMLTGLSALHFVSPAMQWGIDNEKYARSAYEMELDVEIDLAGFAIHDRIPRFGASPDGLIGDDGVVEFKCPNTDTHIGYILADEVPEAYRPQMLAEMACTGRQWCDFVSFDPRLPKHLQLFVKRFQRDEVAIAAMELEVEKFLAEVDDLLAKLKEK